MLAADRLLLRGGRTSAVLAGFVVVRFIIKAGIHYGVILEAILRSNHQILSCAGDTGKAADATSDGSGSPVLHQFCVALATHFMPDDGMVKNKKLVLIAELALVLAGVFVFRGLWMLLDLVDLMHTPIALWLSLVVGSGVTVWAIRCLMKQEGR